MMAELLNLTSLSLELSILLELLLLLLELLSLSMLPPIVFIPSLESLSSSSLSSSDPKRVLSSLSILKPNNDVSKVRSEFGDFLMVIPIFLDNEFGLEADEEV